MVNEGIITSPPPKTNLLEASSLTSCEWFIEAASEEDAAILMTTKLDLSYPSTSSPYVVKVFLYLFNSDIACILFDSCTYIYILPRCTRGGIVQQMLVHCQQANRKICIFIDFIPPKIRFESLSNPTTHHNRQIY